MFFRMVYKSGQIFLPFCHNTRVWQTDRRTDRRTDRILIARPRLHCMQRGKNDGQYFYLFSAELFIRVLLYTSNRHSFSFVTFVRFPVAGCLYFSNRCFWRRLARTAYLPELVRIACKFLRSPINRLGPLGPIRLRLWVWVSVAWNDQYFSVATVIMADIEFRVPYSQRCLVLGL